MNRYRYATETRKRIEPSIGQVWASRTHSQIKITLSHKDKSKWGFTGVNTDYPKISEDLLLRHWILSE